MSAHRVTHRIATLCRVLGVSPSGYYAWRHRPLSPRARADVRLSAQIKAIHTRSRGPYGLLRVPAELAAAGVRIGRKRVARLMRAVGVPGGEPPKGPAHYAPRSRRRARTRSGQPGLCGGRAGSAVGRGYHLHSHVGGLAVVLDAS